MDSRFSSGLGLGVEGGGFPEAQMERIRISLLLQPSRLPRESAAWFFARLMLLGWFPALEEPGAFGRGRAPQDASLQDVCGGSQSNGALVSQRCFFCFKDETGFGVFSFPLSGRCFASHSRNFFSSDWMGVGDGWILTRSL